LALDADLDVLRDRVRLLGDEANSDSDDLIWVNAELCGFDDHAGLRLHLLLEAYVAGDAALVLELNLLALLLSCWDELEVDEWLELNVRSWSEGMKVELEGRVVAFGMNLDHIVEISLLVRFKLHVHLDGEASGDGAGVLVLTVELGSGWLREVDATHVLGDVSDRNSHLVVLVWLDIFEKDLGWEDLDGVLTVSQMVNSRVIEHLRWVLL